MISNLTENSLISVIIPVYNCKEYLHEALNSVIHQTHKELEIIVVDDGSDDGSEKICDEYASDDKRIKVIHNSHAGIGAARNTGLNVFTGDAVMFLDADDAFLDDTVERMLGIMIKSGLPMVICRYASVYSKEKMNIDMINSSFPALPSGTYDLVKYTKAFEPGDSVNSVWNRLYVSELWKDFRFPVDRMYEDVAVSYKIFYKAQRFEVLSDVLYLHRKHIESITASPSIACVRDYLTSIYEIEEYCKSKNDYFPADKTDRIIRLRFSRLLALYFRCQSDDLEERERLRKQIIELRSHLTIKSCGLRTYIAYYILKICPSFTVFMYRKQSKMRKCLS